MSAGVDGKISRSGDVKMSALKDLKDNTSPRTSLPEMIVSSVIGWSTTYFLIKQMTKQEPEWIIRVLTAIHATVITILSILDWYYINEWNIDKLGEPNTEYEEALLSLTLGYFCVDFLWILKYQTEGLAMYFHHVSSIVCLIFILFRGTSASEVLVGISGLEMTNPCLQARWFLRTYGYQGTTVHILTELIFMITFIVFRIFYGSYLTYNILLHPKCHFVLKAGTISLYCISWVFVYQMFSYIFKRYVNKPPEEVNDEE